MRDNPIEVGRRVRSVSMAFLPQGWAFFTRDPREEDRLVYRRSSGKLTAINDRGRGGFETLFGIRRTKRLVQIELMALLETLPAGVWQPCSTTDRPLECVRGIEPLKLRNRSKLNLVCGEFLVVNRPPVPWAWAGSSTAMPGSVMAFDAECSS